MSLKKIDEKKLTDVDVTIMSCEHANMVRAILKKINFQPKMILEIGCADGRFTYQMAQLFQESFVLGFDVDPELIAQATNKFHAKNLDFLVMNPESITLASNFDLIVSFHLSTWMNKPTHVLQGVKNVLREEGQAILMLPLISKLDVLIELLTQKPQWRKIKNNLTDPRIFYTKQEFLRLVIESGLRVNLVETSYISYQLETDKFIELFLMKLPHCKNLSPNERSEFFEDIIASFALNSSVSDKIDLLIPLLEVHVIK